MEDVLQSVKDAVRLALNHLTREEPNKAQQILEKLNGDLSALEQLPLFKPVSGEFRNVRISDLQFKTLVVRLGSVPLANYYIRRLSAYMKGRGRSYPDHYATIISWWEDDRTHGKLPNLSTQENTRNGEPIYRPK